MSSTAFTMIHIPILNHKIVRSDELLLSLRGIIISRDTVQILIATKNRLNWNRPSRLVYKNVLAKGTGSCEILM